MKREDGFTLIELMATMALLSILMTLGVVALRYFWLGQSLTRERDEVYSNMRALQQQVVAESNPLVFGAWFKVMTPASDDGSFQWGTFRYRPGTPATCTSTGRERMSGGVQIRSVAFSNTLSGSSVASIETACRAQIPAAASATDFVFFLARGTATTGCVTLAQHLRDIDDVTVAISGLTARIDQLTEYEALGDPRCSP